MDLSRYVPGKRLNIPPRRRRRRTAFVLSGGGVLGAVQVGQLEALIEAGIVPDMLVGTSVGAVNAAAVAADPTMASIRGLRTVWTTLRGDDLFPGGRVQRAWQLVRKGDSLYPNVGLRRLLAQLPVETFEELRIPLHVAAANLRTGKEHWFSAGPLDVAILASTAIPGVFPPVEADGEVFVDGGVVNNVPISRAVELGATRIFVLSCGAQQPDDRPVRRPLDVFVQAVARTRAARVAEDIERYGRYASIELLPCAATGFVRYNDLSHSARLIDAAAAATRSYLAPAAATV